MIADHSLPGALKMTRNTVGHGEEEPHGQSCRIVAAVRREDSQLSGT